MKASLLLFLLALNLPQGYAQTSIKVGAGISNGIAVNLGVETKIKKVILLEELTPVYSTYNITYYKPTFFQTKIGYSLLPHFVVFTGYAYGLISNDIKKLNKGFINYGLQYTFSNDSYYFKAERVFSVLSGDNICFLIGKKINL